MMARPTSKPAAPAPAPVSRAKQEPDDDVDMPEADGLSAFMAEIGGEESATITVYRLGPNNKQSYVFKTTPAAFSS